MDRQWIYDDQCTMAWIRDGNKHAPAGYCLPTPVPVRIKYTRSETHTRCRVQIMSQTRTRTGGGYLRAARARQSVRYSTTQMYQPIDTYIKLRQQHMININHKTDRVFQKS
jgi:hypothetical protein